MQSRLPDPRQYPAGDLGNMLIHYTHSILTAASDDDADMWRASLRGAIGDLLERDDALLLSVALAMVPSRRHYAELWRALREAVEQPQGRRALVFAMPIVLVAGSRQEATLPERIGDVDGLNALLAAQGVFAPGADVFLSGRLLHPDTVVGISPTRLYRMAGQLADAARGLPVELAASAVTCKGEGVFLRYLAGVAMWPEGEPCPVDVSGKVGAWGVPLMNFIGDALKTDGVTLFPIPRAPMPLMQAMVDGQFARLDVALQVFASSLIRKLRDESLEPVAAVSAHEGGELRFTIRAAGGEVPSEGFVWPLSPLDNVALIEARFCELMAECRVGEVHVEAAVQPDSRDGRAVFSGSAAGPTLQ
ncbi:hypothetical protein [Paludibacterium paludis]|uniref:Uncharacterized protein n=1 Tax=Paludibacterium paludis TaxID=1225769 RepID=A0A918NXP3_9NEIS|nr:hypothetical protein [Paludibacterium paludis]GGY04235.1 hypothetical protein GCM10011289_03350 [Paludibacterium paludis]